MTSHLDPFRHHTHDASAFGTDRFGRFAEKFARTMGTSKFIVGMTIFIIVWTTLNLVGLTAWHWDPYPFILLNLVFSTQASYAAPLILLAQTRQADRDKAASEADALHREEIAKVQSEILNDVHKLTLDVHKVVVEVNNVDAPADGAESGPVAHP